MKSMRRLLVNLYRITALPGFPDNFLHLGLGLVKELTQDYGLGGSSISLLGPENQLFHEKQTEMSFG